MDFNEKILNQVQDDVLIRGHLLNHKSEIIDHKSQICENPRDLREYILKKICENLRDLWDTEYHLKNIPRDSAVSAVKKFLITPANSADRRR